MISELLFIIKCLCYLKIICKCLKKCYIHVLHNVKEKETGGVRICRYLDAFVQVIVSHAIPFLSSAVTLVSE